jgi:hypothetical protein
VEKADLPEHEQKLLEEIAKAQNISVSELLEKQGYTDKPKPDSKLEPKLADEPIIIDKPETESFKMFEEVLTVEEPAAPPEIQTEEERDLDSEVTTLTKMCPYCGWDQELPVLVEPTNMDKQSFLQSILGQKVYSKIYGVLGNQLNIGFRGLTLGEIDSCYQAASAALKKEVFSTQTDYYEYANRLRMSLQLISLVSANNQMYIKLPDGLNRSVNPSAMLYWDDFLESKNLLTDATLVEQVQTYISANVLTTEHLQRIVTTKCTDFNRLISRLEVSVNDENFWKEIELPL